jgi:transcriptional regulator with XRE-family HTH domain
LKKRRVDTDTAEEERLPIFADRLSAALVAARMTQRDLADRVGRSEGAVSRWIGEGRLPGVRTICRIAEATGSSVDWLLGLGPPEARPAPAAHAQPAIDARSLQSLKTHAERLLADLTKIVAAFDAEEDGSTPGRRRG